MGFIGLMPASTKAIAGARGSSASCQPSRCRARGRAWTDQNIDRGDRVLQEGRAGSDAARTPHMLRLVLHLGQERIEHPGFEIDHERDDRRLTAQRHVLMESRLHEVWLERLGFELDQGASRSAGSFPLQALSRFGAETLRVEQRHPRSFIPRPPPARLKPAATISPQTLLQPLHPFWARSVLYCRHALLRPRPRLALAAVLWLPALHPTSCHGPRPAPSWPAV